MTGASACARIPGTMTELAISTSNLGKNFGRRRAVQQLGLRVAAGTFYGLVGPNGAGKTTTIGMLTGVLRPSSGQVHLLGRPLDPDDPWFKRQTGVVAEQPALFSRLRGQEQLMLSARLFGLPADEAARRTRQLLQLGGLEADARTLVADYSRGMRKKLAMACALVHAPRLLFLDEPFEGVDALSSQTLRRVLGALCGRGATVLLTTHILEVAEKLCQRVGIIAAGRLVAEHDMAELRARGSSLQQEFVRAVGAEPDDLELPAWLCGENR